MKSRNLLYSVLLVGGLVWVFFLIAKHRGPEQNESFTQNGSSKNMIIIYQGGKEIRLSPESKNYQELEKNIENFALTADSAYKLIVDSNFIEKVRKKWDAIELFFADPKELKIDYLTRTLFRQDKIVVSSILIPLSNWDLPNDIVIVIISEKDFYLLANTKITKDNIIKLVKSID